jgi:hypothetical protein
MDWIDDALDRLAVAKNWGYNSDSPSATEPIALTALALIGHQRASAATAMLDWLSANQADDGSLGVSANQTTPCWPTSLAMLAWRAADGEKFAEQIRRATDWTLQIKGAALEQSDDLGHDSTLVGWPWVESTHSWVEPTALHVLALRATGQAQHDRTREAIRLLVDRLLPAGGCNYGNTVVLGQTLRPHVQPSGISLLALSGERDTSGKIEKTLVYLERELSAKTTSASLSFGLLGLAAHHRWPAAAEHWLSVAAERTLSRQPAPYKLALLSLAALAAHSPLVELAQKGAA